VDAYDVVVFDMDGVLVRPTEPGVIDRAAREAVTAVDAPAADALVDAFARTATGEFDAVCEPHGLDPAAVWRERERAAARLQAAEIDAGRKTPYDDVGVLDRLDARLGVVSNNQHATVETVLDRFGLGRRVETAYGREPTLAGARRRKPDPHYVERALADLGVDGGADRRRALYVGDSRVDVTAAARAGVDSAFLRRSHRRGYELDRSPTHEFGGLEGLLDL
jgi:HAD superfamily hydrolase (TIGR01549 family)